MLSYYQTVKLPDGQITRRLKQIPVELVPFDFITKMISVLSESKVSQ